MARVLVTGASGFIGRHLVPKLRGNGHDVVTANSASGDIANESTWARLPDVEIVIHLAGKTFVPDSWIDPGAFLMTNFGGAIRALDYCRVRQARLVFVSAYLYGVPE